MLRPPLWLATVLLGKAIPIPAHAQALADLSGFAQYLPVQTERRQDGKAVRGYRVNESSLAILVRDQAGTIHSFDKDELETLVKQFGQSIMPSYRDGFTDDELDDIVAYLISLRELRP